MTSHDDPFATHRASLRAAIQAALEGVHYTYGAVLLRQVATLAKHEDVLLPGLLCLTTADAIDAKAEAALPVASSLVLLGTMSLVFEGIAAEGTSELERDWGMPRALNAGDAFYALAQETVLNASKELSADNRLKAVAILDSACHELSLEMHAGTPGSPALLSAGAALGALFAGGGGPITEQMRSFGRDLSTSDLGSLNEAAREKLTSAATYLRQWRTQA